MIHQEIKVLNTRNLWGMAETTVLKILSHSLGKSTLKSIKEMGTINAGEKEENLTQTNGIK